MDVDVFEGSWEHIPEYNSHHAKSDSSGGESSNALSPSLQSYLNANDPSWAGDGGGLAFSPQQHQQRRDPTAIYRAEIARIGRRFGSTTRAPAARIPTSSGVDRQSTRLAASTYSKASSRLPSAGLNHVRSSRDVRSGHGEATKRTWRGVAPQRQIEGFLKQGLDGRVALTGKRPGNWSSRRSVGPAPLSTASRIWDNPAPVRATARSAGPTRSRASRRTGLFSSSVANLWGRAEGSTNTLSDGQVPGRRPRTAPAVQTWVNSDRGGRRTRSPGGFTSGADEGFSPNRLPELSRSTSPMPHRRSANASAIFGPGGNSHDTEFGNSRDRSDFVPVRALLLLPDWSIGHEVSTVAVSPFDSVSFLRAAIQADIVRDWRAAGKASAASNGQRHGHGRHCNGDGCPSFAFSYADGVAIDLGQEDRLSVKDIAVASASAAGSAAAGAAAHRSTFGQPWETEDESGGSGEMHVFLRVCEPQAEENATGEGGGVLHRWESLEAGSWENEVYKQAVGN